MKHKNNGVDVIVVSAGKGSRMKTNMNKMFLEINGVPILYWTLFRLNNCQTVARIILVSRKNEIQQIREMIEKRGRLSKLKKIIEGGRERSDSVKNGIKYLVENPESAIVMTHDGARPLFTDAILSRLKEAAVSKGASIPVLRINETTRREIDKDVAEVIDRNSLFITQTPQAFKFEYIQRCFLGEEKEQLSLTDEASYLEAEDLKVKMVEGEKWNIKITTPEDIKWAECLLDFHPELIIDEFE